MAKGAADCMVKPIYNSYDENVEVIKSKLTEIFKVFYEKQAEKNVKTEPMADKTAKKSGKEKFNPEIVLIAASTGGPFALENILSKLRGDLPVPVLIVQHMPAHFAETLAYNLNRKSPLKIKVAQNRENVEAGTVYIAPGGLHMTLDRKNRIYLDDSPPLHGVRPAADALFESVAEYFNGAGVLAVILTGMGNDGQTGLIGLKEKQACFCLAQSEKTCVVYGMPRAAAESGLVDRILDLDEIPGEIENFYFTAAAKTKQSLKD